MPGKTYCNHGAARVESERIETTRQIVDGDVLRPGNVARREFGGLADVDDLKISMIRELRNQIVRTDRLDMTEGQPPRCAHWTSPG